jgi:hypothetical protein
MLTVNRGIAAIRQLVYVYVLQTQFVGQMSTVPLTDIAAAE